MEEKWEIAEVRGACAGCGRALEGGEGVVSGLLLSQETFERRDFCSACWEKADHAPFFSFWRTKVPEKEEKPKARAVDARVLEDLFQRLLQEKDPAREGQLFLVTILLIQRRVLKYREMRTEGGRRVLVVGKPRSPKTFQVVDPGLEPGAMTALWEDLKRALAAQDEDA
ncbi:MAG: hypothetical protein MUC63_09480 [Planctomycetes bacterium]|nr:hypothetical protein [Planctomycetota bacterium]